jgi:hypothetical protein
MSDEDNVREEYRPLTEREREILELLLSVEVEGIDELRAQVPHVLGARWTCGCASFNLVVDEARAPRSVVAKSPLSETKAKNPGDSERYYELLLWVNEGWLSQRGDRGLRRAARTAVCAGNTVADLLGNATPGWIGRARLIGHRRRLREVRTVSVG